jgi:hypothetical protein
MMLAAGVGLRFGATATLSESDFRSGLLQLFDKGIGKDVLDGLIANHGAFSQHVLKSKGKAAENVRQSLTGILSPPPASSIEGDAALSMLMSLRERYKNTLPNLSLGTILVRAKGNATDYLLCLQPVCDSVRLGAERSYPFIPLTVVADSKACNFIVKDRTELRFLTIKYSPYLLEMVRFVPNTNGQVTGELNTSKDVFFPSNHNEVTFRWIADLKPAHAQRVANNFANAVSRVGLVESEWNRLGAPKA